LETSFIPVLLCPGLSSALVVAQGLYRAIVSMSGIEVAEAVETFEATVADRDVAKALHMRPGEAAMHLVRTAGTRTGQPVEYCDTLIRGDRYRFRVTLK
jgi:GntR family transcriptional regulator